MERAVAFEMTLQSTGFNELNALIGAHARSVVALANTRAMSEAAFVAHQAALEEEERAGQEVRECVQRRTDAALEDMAAAKEPAFTRPVRHVSGAR